MRLMVVDAVSSASVNTNYVSYSDYEAICDVSRETNSAECGSAVGDSSRIGSFGAGRGTGELNDLYS